MHLRMHLLSIAAVVSQIRQQVSKSTVVSFTNNELATAKHGFLPHLELMTLAM